MLPARAGAQALGGPAAPPAPPVPPVPDATIGAPMPDLARFLGPQEGTHATALAELRRGRKDTHWMWWVFPQLAALGRSPTAKAYGIADAGEAAAYLAHPVLGPRLIEAARAVLAHEGREPAAILGGVDALKLRSCATLFAAVPGAPPEFRAILDAFYGGEPDPLTLAALGGA